MSAWLLEKFIPMPDFETPPPNKHKLSITGATVSELDTLTSAETPKTSRQSAYRHLGKSSSRATPEQRQEERHERQRVHEKKKREKSLNKQRQAMSPDKALSPPANEDSGLESSMDLNARNSSVAKQNQDITSALFQADEWKSLLKSITETRQAVSDNTNKMESVEASIASNTKDLKQELTAVEKRIRSEQAESERRVMTTIQEKSDESKQFTTSEITRMELELQKIRDEFTHEVQRLKDIQTTGIDKKELDELVKKQVKGAVDASKQTNSKTWRDEWRRRNETDRNAYNICVNGIKECEDTPEGLEEEKQLLVEKLRWFNEDITYEKDIRFHKRFPDNPKANRPLPIRVTFRRKQDVENYLDTAYHAKNERTDFFADTPKHLRDQSRRVINEVKALNEQDPTKKYRLLGLRGIWWGYEEIHNDNKENNTKKRARNPDSDNEETVQKSDKKRLKTNYLQPRREYSGRGRGGRGRGRGRGRGSHQQGGTGQRVPAGKENNQQPQPKLAKNTTPTGAEAMDTTNPEAKNDPNNPTPSTSTAAGIQPNNAKGPPPLTNTATN